MSSYNTHRSHSVQVKHALNATCWALENIGPVLDTAPDVHRAVAIRLAAMGANVKNEYPMPYMGNASPRRGRIDVYANLGGVEIAIELDARRPRQMSLNKLRSFDGLRICGLRGVSGECPDGIDAVVAIQVKMRP